MLAPFERKSQAGFLEAFRSGFLFRGGRCVRCRLAECKGRFPAAAEGFIEGDEAGQDVGFTLEALVLGGEEGALGVEDVKEIDETLFVEVVGDVECFLAGLDGGGEFDEAVLFFGVADEGVFDVFEGVEDGLFVGEEGLLLSGVLYADIGADASGVEDGPLDCGSDRP